MKRRDRDEWWEKYLNYLENSPQSIRRLVEKLSPIKTIEREERVKISKNYDLWPFQKDILKRVLNYNKSLIVGLPTGLGKTYLAGAYLEELSRNNGIRVLFLVPSVPLGVQQTLFAREKLNIERAYFISGAIAPDRRKALNVWKAAFIVTTPQTFSNDHLYPFKTILRELREEREPLENLKEYLDAAEFKFPFDIVIADECQRYIGETDGYSILLAAAACKVKILALSATPQLHSPKRLIELRKIFDDIEVFPIESPEIKRYIPKRLLYIVRIPTPKKLQKTFTVINRIIGKIEREIAEKYGSEHLKKHCDKHSECKKRMMLKLLNFRMMENGASSVIEYGTWRIRELRSPIEDLDGKSILKVFREALRECYNHKIEAAMKILGREKFQKAIIFAEGVETVRQLGRKLQENLGMDNVAILVGKGYMTIEQQASALIQFKEKARILVTTSVGEEGLDIPTADIEVWIDPPSNPRKWIQRFGRILRQPSGMKIARIYALISMRTHERNKLLSVMRKTEKIYGFTQKVIYKNLKNIEVGQTSLTSFLRDD